MKTLIVEANRHARGPWTPEQSKTDFIACPKWRAANLLAQTLEADIAWRSPKVAPDIRGGYDTLVFNRALPDINANAAWLEANPTAKVFHVTNDYSVTGGALYAAARTLGRQVNTIANYERAISKVAGRMAMDWLQVNLNVLVYEAYRKPTARGTGCVYYGACRWGRRWVFQKYMTGHVTYAGDPRVVEEFKGLGVPGPFIKHKIPWHLDGLSRWANSIYFEDSVTADYSPYLSNRFYEAIGYGLYPVFVEECQRTLKACGYDIPQELVISHPDEIPERESYENPDVLACWRAQATTEQRDVLKQIKTFVRGNA